MNDDFFPFGIYDTRICQLVHIGLYKSKDDCWRIYLGWPTRGEVKSAKTQGLMCVGLTVKYNPSPDTE